jgi:TRAP-type transport system periplasmic protein
MLAAAIATVSCVAVQATVGASARPHAAKYLIKFALAGGLPSPEDLAAVQFQQTVQKQSHGQIQVQLYYNNVLGPNNETTQSVGSDVTQMTQTSVVNLAEYVPAWDFLQTPFIFSSTEQITKGLNTAYVKNLALQFEQKSGVRILSWDEGGWVDFISKVGFLTKPSDFNGLKIRVVPGSPTVSGVEEQLGADPIPIELAEVFTAEQSGTVNTTDEPLSSFYTTKDYENLPYLTLGFNFQVVPGTWQINENFFSSLPRNLRQIIQSAANAGAVDTTNLTNQRANYYIKQMALAGAKEYTLTAKQRQAIYEAAKPYLKSLLPTYGTQIFKAFGVPPSSL